MRKIRFLSSFCLLTLVLLSGCDIYNLPLNFVRDSPVTPDTPPSNPGDDGGGGGTPPVPPILTQPPATIPSGAFAWRSDTDGDSLYPERGFYSTLNDAIADTSKGQGSAADPIVIWIVNDITMMSSGDAAAISGTAPLTGSGAGIHHARIESNGKSIIRGTAGFGSLISVTNNGSLVLGGDIGTGLIIDGALVSATGALVSADGSSVTIQNGAVLKNNGHTGTDGVGGVKISGAGGSFTMSGGEISNCTARSGAGVFITGGATGSIAGGAIRGNTALVDGGGVYFEDGALLTISGGIIGGTLSVDANHAGFGGGLYIYTHTPGTTTVTMTGGLISGNFADQGTASQGRLGGGVNLRNAIFNMSGGEITSNEAVLGGIGPAKGGGIIIDESAAQFTMSGTAVIGGNTAPSGAGVQVNNGSFRMQDDAKVDSNNTVALAANMFIEISGALSAPLSAHIDPPAHNASVRVLSGSSSPSSPPSGSNIKFTVVQAADGRLWTIDTNGLLHDNGPVSGLMAFRSDTAAQYYTSLKNAVEDLSMGRGASASPIVIEIINNHDINNSNRVTIDGAVTSSTINHAQIVSSGKSIRRGTAGFGSLINVTNGGTLVLGGAGTGLTLDGQTTNTSGALVTAASGAALTIKTGAVLKNNGLTGTNGIGGVNFTGPGTFTMSGGEISDNRSQRGGGVYITGAVNASISGGTISGNTASIDGGGVFMESGGTLLMSGGSISANHAEYGAGLYIHNSVAVTMTGGEISGNTTTPTGTVQLGGGVNVWGAVFTMTGGEIKQNRASLGGGIVMDNDGPTANVTISGTASITLNEASSTLSANNGGGIYVKSGMLTLGGTASINTNHAVNGGGVWLNTGTFMMSGTTSLNMNTADSNGGGLYNNSGTFQMTESASVSGNSATNSPSYGGGVYNNDGTLQMSGNASMSGNSATTGGGVYNNKTFQMSGNASMSGNSATTGGGVYNRYSFQMSGSASLDGNSASSGGGGVFLSSDTIASFQMQDNATLLGGEVYLFSGKTVDIIGSLGGAGIIATIRPISPSSGLQVLSGSTSGNNTKFAVNPSSYTISSGGTLTP